LNETGKYFYVTPIAYLKLLGNFKNIYLEKLGFLVNLRDKYKNGVKKLDDCGALVDEMKINLVGL
jgi:hypothetical protein